MHATLATYKNRLAYRMTALLLMALLVPVLVFSILTYSTLSHHLYESTEHQLQQARVQSRQLLMNRLTTLSQELQAFIDASISKGPSSENQDFYIHRIHHWFQGLYFERPEETPLIIFGSKDNLTTPSQDDKLLMQLGKPVLKVESSKGQLSGIYFFQALDPKDLTKGWIVAKANLEYLWSSENFNLNYQYCIVDSKRLPLFCPDQFGQLILPYISHTLTNGSGSLYSEVIDHKYLISYDNIPIGNIFYSPDWMVILAKSTDQIWAPLNGFLILFPLLIIASIILVVFISINQIKKVLNPLQKLRQGTRNLMNQQYDKTVSINTGDEFEELAKSFNDMSYIIGKQFNTLETMAHIDRLILSTLDFDSIVETILSRMMKIISCDSVNLLVRNEKNSGYWQLYYRHHKLVNRISSLNVEVRHEDISEMCANPDSFVIDNNGLSPMYLDPIKHNHIGFLILPIFLQDQLMAAIVLGYQHEVKYSSDDLIHAKDLAHRIAVALSNAAWENKLYHKAHFDALTNLPNRILFQERLQHAITRAERENTLIALIFLDLDRFKFINDSLGHDAGDEFLIETAKRLTHCVRKVDTVSRLGGDEFTIILPDFQNSEQVRQDVSTIATKILQTIESPYILRGQEVNSSASIGIAIYPHNGNCYSELLKNADSAMYYAKVNGKNNFQFYSEDLNVEAKTLLILENQLHHALENEEFCLHYQPRINLHTGEIVGAEALIRWQHPERGLISPHDFIPIAEENGLICKIGEWAIFTACEQMRRWHKLGFDDLKVAVNISAYQFHSQNVPLLAQAALLSSGMSASTLEIEITESALMDDIDQAIMTLESLNEMGVRISIDDFGTGYSSLNYLKRFPIDILKIDQSFIHNIAQDTANHAIVLAIVNLAHNLDLCVIAEGVEQEKELEILRGIQCDEVQGFLFSKALPPDEFLAYLQKKSAAH